jgi:hypothetical protein
MVDEGSSGVPLAVCVPCGTIVGVWANLISRDSIRWDDEQDDEQDEEPKAQEYVINQDGSFGGMREVN